MADETDASLDPALGNGADTAPQVGVLSQYVKDLSFENPSAPAVYQWQGQPQIDVQVNIGANQLADDIHEVVLRIEIVAKAQEGTAFQVELLFGETTEDHPFEYASFEGIIPLKQYGAGNVIVWDCGVFSPDEDQQDLFDDRAAAQAQLREGLQKGKLSLFLRGEKLKGSFALVRTTTDQQWLLIKHKDRFVSVEDINARHRYYRFTLRCGGR